MQNIDENKLTKLLEALKTVQLLSEESVDGGTGTGAAATGIATSDEHIKFESLYQQVAIPSVARSIFTNAPLSGPTGAIFNIRKKEDTDAIELLRSEVEVYASAPIKTEITQEAIEDISKTFGEDGVRAIAIMMQGLASADENVKLAAFLETNAVEDTETFQLQGVNSKDCFYELSKRVSKTVLQMNSNSVKTFRASVLLPYELAATVMGFGKGDVLPNTTTFYVGGTELHDYYINPDPTATDIFVILSDKYDGSKGAGIYSPYQNFINKAIDPETGEYVYFIYNRFALAISPLHTTGDPSITKFSYITD